MKECIRCGELFANTTWDCPSCNNNPPTIDGFITFSKDLAKDNKGFDSKNFEKLFKLESNSFWFMARNDLLIWAIKKHFAKAKTFLEIGCGTGFVLSGIEKTIPALSLTGTEIYTKGLSFTSQRLKHAELFQMDARHIPFFDEFDVIGAFDVLEHIENDELVLSQMHKAVSRKGGGIIITVPQHMFMWSKTDVDACHVRRYSSKELISKVENAGFTVVETTSFVSLLFPLMAISRYINRFSNRNGNTELNLGNLTNKLFKKVLDFERILIKLGVSFPCGGSLLLIAKVK